MKLRPSKTLLAVAVFAMFVPGIGIATSEIRNVSIDTQEITRPDVAVSPDGDWLVFTALGHLFRVPASGGTAEQLTFGPWYDSDPAISPDGRSIVFASDRDGANNGNLFLIDIESGEIGQLTNEDWVSRPAWSPDGRRISYLSYQRRGHWSEYEFVARDGVVASVRHILASGGPPSHPDGKSDTDPSSVLSA